MKTILFASISILCFALISCSEDDLDLNSIPQFSSIIEVIYWINDTGDSTTIRYREFVIDSGYVTAIKSIDGERIGLFEYDSLGRLIQYKNGEEHYMEFIWEDDNSEVSVKNWNRYLKYSDNHIIEIDNNRRFEYKGDNIVSAYLDDELQYEYLNYNTKLIHPEYYLKSIEPWMAILYYRPAFVNPHDIRRDLPYSGDDFFSGLHEHKIEYEIMDQYRITSIAPNWSIYTWHYEFYP